MKFNTAAQGVNRTVTYEGGEAVFTPNKKEDLVRRVLTTFIYEPKFYGRVEEQTKELVDLIKYFCEKDPKFIANLARYARNELYMRSISHVLIAELARSKNGKSYVKSATADVVNRPDDMTEILAYYLNVYGKPVPNSLKKGLAKAFCKFNEYQLGKYNRKAQVSLKDILCLTHPKPSSMEQARLWKNLLENELEVPYTWETELSTKGNTKAVWEDLINSKKVGYMALLRNLRNMLQVSPDNLNEVLAYLENPVAVLKSKQLPFRFFSAYKEIEKVSFFSSRDVLNTLENALEASVANLEKIPGKTFIAADDSGSMTWTNISSRSTITAAQIAGLLMSIANSLCEKAITSLFSSSFRVVNLNPHSNILENTNKVTSMCEGGGTQTHLVFKHLLENKVFTDRILILSDDQGFYSYPRVQNLFDEYRRIVNKNANLFIVDVAGYGRQQFLGENVYYIGGWSEKILTFINLIEKRDLSLVTYIENLT
jgi:60 kDa SS-A/Ro ribonucleoprotein